jgi:peptidoglycan/LPS O-acetylase OafA/YrhL
MSLDTASRERRNNFDVLRLAAASLVLVSHSFVVVGHHEPTVGHFQLGTLGVEIFFAISGFLVAKSWFSQPRLGAFVLKRALRIVPALAVTVAALAFVVGPAVSHDAPKAYFGAAQTYAYPVDNVAAVATGGSVRHVSHDLPGVFATNPDTSVDRSLWTLPIEAQAYMAIALLGIAGVLSGALPLLVAGFFLLSVAPTGVLDLPGIGPALEFVRGADGEAAHLLAIFSSPGWHRSGRPSSAGCSWWRSPTWRSIWPTARGAGCAGSPRTPTSPTACTCWPSPCSR